MKIAVIGSGSFGTSISVILGNKGYDVALWSFDKDEAHRIEKDRGNIALLPDIYFTDNVHCTDDMESTCKDAELVVTVVPSFATRQTARKLSQYVKDGQKMVNLSKGLETDTLKRMSQVYAEEIPNARIAVMSGPSHAEEVARNIPTTNVVAADDEELCRFIQDTVMGETFRIYRSDDKIGVEIGGAIKNVIALCAGISDGLGYGDNTKAALMTRGIAEIKRLGVAMGAKGETFLGLSGIGDLIVTCTSMHSRNRRCGILLGQGYKLEKAQQEVNMVVEGVNTAKAAYDLSKKYNISMPIINEAYKVLFENKSPRIAVNDLMMRDKTSE